MFDASFGILAPMLAHSIDQPFDSPDYIFEPKWDGFRCLSYLAPGETRLFSRNQKKLTAFFPELAGLDRLIAGHFAVLDGEIVTLVNGSPNFQALLARTRSTPSAGALSRQVKLAPAVYMVFDILIWNDRDLMSLPLEERKARLGKVVAESESCVITRFIPEHGISLYEAVRAQKLEGIVAKRLDSIYTPGKRSHSWLKCKVVRSVDACIVGFTPKNRSLGSLALAVYKNAPPQLYYIGHVGTGFSEQEAETMRRFFDRYVCTRSELNIQNVTIAVDRATQWVHPTTVCQVNFLELTSDHRLRHPSFVGIRADKRPDECTWEQLPQ